MRGKQINALSIQNEIRVSIALQLTACTLFAGPEPGAS